MRLTDYQTNKTGCNNAKNSGKPGSSPEHKLTTFVPLCNPASTVIGAPNQEYLYFLRESGSQSQLRLTQVLECQIRLHSISPRNVQANTRRSR